MGSAEEASASVPTEALCEAMRRHLAEVHGQEFDLERDVYTEGSQAQDPPLSFELATPARGARFWCRDCPGMVFPVGEPLYGDPERLALVQRNEPALRGLLADLSADEQAALTDAWDRGEVGKAMLTSLQKRRSMTSARRQMPEAARRKEEAQAFLLDAYVQLGTVERAIDALMALRREDPERYRKIMGREHPFAEETLRGYWHDIDPDLREAVRSKQKLTP